LVYIKENNVRVTMKLEVFKRFVIMFTLFIVTVERVCSERVTRGSFTANVKRP